MHPTISTALAGAVLWSSTVSAVCKSWHQDRRFIDTASDFSNTQSQTVDNMLCPADSQSSCKFNRRSYGIDAERTLTGSGGLPLNLPRDEADAIFQLVRDGFNEDTPKLNKQFRFKSIRGSVSTDSTDPSSPSSSILEVDPGMNKSLVWTSFYGYSWGVLSGCTNETLNNKTIMAGTPYLNDQLYLAGTWGAVWDTDDDKEDGDDNNDNDDGSRASSLRGDTTSVWVITTMVLAFIF